MRGADPELEPVDLKTGREGRPRELLSRFERFAALLLDGRDKDLARKPSEMNFAGVVEEGQAFPVIL